MSLPPQPLGLLLQLSGSQQQLSYMLGCVHAGRVRAGINGLSKRSARLSRQGSNACGGTPEPTHDTGKYVEIWRQQPDGKWLLAVDISNSDLPLPE